MDAIHEHARDSGLRLKGRRAIWNIDGVVGCLRNFIPIGLQPAWVEFAAGRAQWSCVLNWLQGEMKSPGGMRRELATPQLVHNSTLRPDHDMGTIKSG